MKEIKKILKASGYILTSVIIAVLTSSELQELLASNPEIIAYIPVINIILVTIVKILSKGLKNKSK